MKINEIDKILGELSAYLNPDFFLPPFSDVIKTGPLFNKKRANSYWESITSINWFLKKLGKYEIYFLEFYSDTISIPKHEALEHHIHAYLEDLSTVKNKLTKYVNMMKNDLKKVVTNKKEVTSALKWLSGQIHKCMKKTSDLRDFHRHQGYRFVDKSVVDAEMASTLLDSKFGMKDLLTPYGVEKLTKQKSSSFEEGKNYWSKNAASNYIQVSGLVNKVMAETKDFLYSLLDIKPIDFDKISSETK